MLPSVSSDPDLAGKDVHVLGTFFEAVTLDVTAVNSLQGYRYKKVTIKKDRGNNLERDYSMQSYKIPDPDNNKVIWFLSFFSGEGDMRAGSDVT